MKKTFALAFGSLALALLACSPEDRSSEVPLKPTVSNIDCSVEGDSCLLLGEVTASPNSSLKGCGFEYGNDTLKANVKCPETGMQFSAYTRRLRPGTYYAVAYAENGMGKSLAPDSMHFTISE